jgi:transposase
MSDSLHTYPQPNEPADPDALPEASPQPGAASASVERRRSRSATPADAAPAAPGNASASFGFVACNPDPERLAAAETLCGGEAVDEGLVTLPPLARGRQRGRWLVLPVAKGEALRPEQRLLLLDIWQRSGLPGADFAALVGISKFTLYAWKKKFEQQGPAGLMDKPKGGRAGSRLPELTKRTIVMLKQANPDWGCQKISDMLLRGPALPASAAAVAKVLHEAGYQMEESPPAARAAGNALRAGPAQSAVANRPVHVYVQAAKSPGLLGGLHGRSQPLRRRLRAARQPVVGVGD